MKQAPSQGYCLQGNAHRRWLHKEHIQRPKPEQTLHGSLDGVADSAGLGRGGGV